MTAPGLGPTSDLPEGVLKASQLGAALQGLNAAKVGDTTAARLPDVFTGTLGGSLVDAPIQYVMGLFAQFLGDIVDDGTPAITGPEELPDRTHDFFEDLPLVGIFVSLSDAMLGTYDGDDPVMLGIQDLFGLLRKLLELIGGVASGQIPDIGELVGGFADLMSKIVGLIDPSRLGVIPFWNLGDTQENLVEAHDFADPIVLDAGASGFYWDADHGVDGGGCLAVDADGGMHAVSAIKPRRVAADQQLKVRGKVAWQWVTGSVTDGARLMLDTFNEGVSVSSVQVAAITLAGTQPVLQQIEGTWTVPAGVTHVAVRLMVSDDVADGTVYFDDIEMYFVQLMKMAWTKNLEKRWEETAGLFGVVDTDLDGDVDFTDVWNTLWAGGLKPLNWVSIADQGVIDRIINAFNNSGALIDTDLGLGGVLDAIFGIFDTGLTANNRVSELEVQLRQLVSGANSISEGFDGAASTSLGSNWAQSYSGGGAGSLGRDGKGNATWRPSGAGNRTGWARYTPSTFDVDCGHITTQLASSPQSYVFDDAFTYLCWRVNSAMDTYVRLRIGYDEIRVQKVVAGTVSTIGSAWSGNPKGGNVIEVIYGEPGGTNLGHYIVKRNGVTILDVTDGSPVTGVGYRQHGIGMETGNRLVLFQNIPAGLGVFTAVEVL